MSDSRTMKTLFMCSLIYALMIYLLFLKFFDYLTNIINAAGTVLKMAVFSNSHSQLILSRQQ